MFEQMAADGRDVPDAPEIHANELFFWDGFRRLASSRPIGMAPGGIPVSEMLAYLDLVDIRDVETRMMFVDIISALDGEFLNMTGDKNGG